MANPSKQKGTRAETKVVRYLESRGIKARRKALAGSNDQGDIEMYDAPRLGEPITIEVKAGKQTANPNRAQLEDWLRQSWEEAENSGTFLAVLIVVRYRRKLEDADVYVQAYSDNANQLRTYHTWLDKFAEEFT